MAVAGLPGAAVYKAINTADSMIGHRTPRHGDFGFAAARLDDLVNLPASRLSAVLIVAAAAFSSRGGRTRLARRPARRSPSPFAQRRVPGSRDGGRAWSRARGPASLRRRAGRGRRDGERHGNAGAADIRKALVLYHRADALLIALLGLVAALVIAIT
jgi:adenosylcobinamide-phosphate synthase